MIHIIVYSTTDTVAKMYKIKEKKDHFKVTREEEDNGRDACSTPPRLWESRPKPLCCLHRWWLVVSSKGI